MFLLEDRRKILDGILYFIHGWTTKEVFRLLVALNLVSDRRAFSKLLSDWERERAVLAVRYVKRWVRVIKQTFTVSSSYYPRQCLNITINTLNDAISLLINSYNSKGLYRDSYHDALFFLDDLIRDLFRMIWDIYVNVFPPSETTVKLYQELRNYAEKRLDFRSWRHEYSTSPLFNVLINGKDLPKIIDDIVFLLSSTDNKELCRISKILSLGYGREVGIREITRELKEWIKWRYFKTVLSYEGVPCDLLYFDEVGEDVFPSRYVVYYFNSIESFKRDFGELLRLMRKTVSLLPDVPLNMLGSDPCPRYCSAHRSLEYIINRMAIKSLRALTFIKKRKVASVGRNIYNNIISGLYSCGYFL